MERYSFCDIDEFGGLVLHAKLRQRLQIKPGDEVSVVLVGTIIILRRIKEGLKPDCAVSKVDEAGRIFLPAELIKKLGWQKRDKLFVYHADDMLILKPA